MPVKVDSLYSVYLQRNGETITLQVYPSEIITREDSANSKYNVLGIGEIAIPRDPPLKTVSWDGFMTYDLDLPYVVTKKEPSYYIDLFENIKKNKEQVRIVVLRKNPDGSKGSETNMLATIDDFEIKDKGGEPGIIYYSITILEYRNHAPVKVEFKITKEKVTATESGSRAKETTELYVGAAVIANGRYYYDSYGAKPFGTANNRQTTVTRIVSDPARPYPIHIGQLGWLQKSQLTIIK